jgi:hypothetical protein
MTPHGVAWGVGGTTLKSVFRYVIDEVVGLSPESWGGRDEWDNGNGSLMRILPVALWLSGTSDEEVIAKSGRSECPNSRPYPGPSLLRIPQFGREGTHRR